VNSLKACTTCRWNKYELNDPERYWYCENINSICYGDATSFKYEDSCSDWEER